MKHFGLNINESKYGFLLTKENYAIINKKSSLNTMTDYLFIDKKYEILPKDWVLAYFTKMRDHILSLPKYKLQASLKKRLALLKIEISRYQTLNNDHHLLVLRDMWENEETNLSFDEYCHIHISKIHTYMEPFDLDFDIMGRYYKDSWCEELYHKVMKNYELNMTYFQSLNEDEFNQGIEHFLSVHQEFKEIEDLQEYMNRSGYFIIVVDKYKQLYIGSAAHIGERIRQHWNGRKDFDRLLYPADSYESSKISIDSFRALDSTRIFIFETDIVFHHEENFIKQFNPKFVLNRIMGGKITELLD